MWVREQLHEGVKKAGLMGFCDPCPGESKQLKVAYSYLGQLYEVRGCGSVAQRGRGLEIGEEALGVHLFAM
jgi:hypothetical protein